MGRRKHLDSGYARPDLNTEGRMQVSMQAQGMNEAEDAIAAHEEEPEVKPAAPVSHADAANMAHTASQVPTNTANTVTEVEAEEVEPEEVEEASEETEVEETEEEDVEADTSELD